MNFHHRQDFTEAARLATPVPADPGLLTAYYAQVSSYQEDRLRAAQRHARLGYIVGAAGLLLALAGVGAVAALAPQKTVVPLVFRVDNATGAVERVFDVTGGGAMAASEATRRYFLWQYVRLRQGYSFAEAQLNFDAVAAMSTPTVEGEYVAAFRGSNPSSPQVVLGRDGTATLRWKSTAFLGPKLAQVRFEQIEQKPGQILAPKHMVATIGFDFVAGQVKELAQNINPLGFVVTSYRVDQEAV